MSLARAAPTLGAGPQPPPSLCPDGLALRNEAALTGAVATVQALVGGVVRLVARHTARCEEELRRRRLQSAQDGERVALMLVSSPAPPGGAGLALTPVSLLQEEHRRDTEAVLAEGALMGLAAIQELHASLGATAQSQRVLAHRVGPRSRRRRPGGSALCHRVVLCRRWRP